MRCQPHAVLTLIIILLALDSDASSQVAVEDAEQSLSHALLGWEACQVRIDYWVHVNSF